MILQKTLRKRLLANQPLKGVLLRSPSEELVEIVAANGLDFILLDCEHGPSDQAIIRQHIASAALFGVETIVRVGEGDDSLILRVLDSGASGLVIPHLEKSDQAAVVGKKAKYPPEGNRGFALYSRAASYGNVCADEYRQNSNDSTLIVGMIESPRAAACAAEILDEPLVDAYMIGVSDLAASISVEDRTIDELVAATHDGARMVGKRRVEIVNDVESARRARENGAQVIVYNLTALLKNVLAGLV